MAMNQRVDQSAPAGVTVSKLSQKSLFFCLVLDNPFFIGDHDRNRVADENRFLQQQASGGNPATYLTDEELYRRADEPRVLQEEEMGMSRHASNTSDRSSGTRGSDENDLAATLTASPTFSIPETPNKYQKVIEIMLRLQKRGVDFHPQECLIEVPIENQTEEYTSTTPNYFHGYALDESALWMSPDQDEIYLCLHCQKSALAVFAEQQGIIMATNPYSFAGGNGVTYAAETEKRLQDSVNDYAAKFEVPEDYLGKKGAWGFRWGVPQKMRMLDRLVRESWAFGGCGVQIDEMKRRSVLVRNFFPLHNKVYLREKGMSKWGDIRQVISKDPLKQDDEVVLQYLGERVALYFTWLREYTMFLRWIALVGTAIGILDLIGVSRSLLNTIFSFFCVLWGVAWNQKWLLREKRFVSDLVQDVEAEQELARDEFRPMSLRRIGIDDVYEKRFGHPAALHRHADGTLREQYYPIKLRMAIRILFTYPILIVLTTALIASLLAITYWRFSVDDDLEANQSLSYAASAATVAIGLFFGRIFDYLVPWLNYVENNRTEDEEENQLIIKSFFFYFLSSYFALFAIMLWPLREGQKDYVRLIEMGNQMLITTVAKPMLQNAQELLIPFIKMKFRREIDLAGGFLAAMKKRICCCCGMNAKEEEAAERAALFRRGDNQTNDDPRSGLNKSRVWREAQRACYDTTAPDHLEIALQFGYMSMFAASFSWSALAALCYNVLEMRIDSRKLIHYHQRTLARTATGIGAWKWIFAMLSGLSILTNSYMTCILSPAPSKVGLSKDEDKRYKYFSVMQYTLVACALALRFILGNEPVGVAKERVKRALLRDASVRTRILQQLGPRARSQYSMRARFNSVASSAAPPSAVQARYSTASAPQPAGSMSPDPIEEYEAPVYDSADDDEDDLPLSGEGAVRQSTVDSEDI